MTKTGQAMKNSQDAQQNIEDYEDLTLFADESFNTEDVDLFEFTSEEDSVLTRLKSIILSLDWEISDDILQELADEVENLQEIWQDDKIAEVYLQGLGKIGRYLRSKGAYAHPNAIKLLLTFFYNFEKITSSEKITDTEVTMLLKGDIRKFRILQYQINKTEGSVQTAPTVPVEEPVILTPAPEEETVVNPEEEDHLRMLKASILSLDWEVTAESLEQFNTHLEHFQKQLTGDKPALVLVQGLRALGDYISEEKARSHPESFTLLHAFSDALEQVLHVDPEQRDQEQMRALLVDRVGRLNGLKSLIAEKGITPQDDDKLDEVVDEITAPALFEEPSPEEPMEEEPPAGPPSLPDRRTSEELKQDDDSIVSELDDLFPSMAVAGMESSDTRYPDEILPPDAIHPVDDSVADNLIHAEVGGRRGFTPALSEALDDSRGFSEDFEPLDVPTQSDLTEQLDKLFADDSTDSVFEGAEESPVPEPEQEQPEITAAPSEEGILSALSDVDLTEEEHETHAGMGEDNELAQDIGDKLDFFFGDDEEEEEQETPAPEPAQEKEDDFSPALADSDEESGFSEESSLASMDTTSLPDIEEKLDFFFKEDAGDTVEEDSSGVKPAAATAALETDDELIADLDSFLDASEEDSASEELTLSLEDELPESSTEESLDIFLGTAEDDEDGPIAEDIDELTRALEGTIEEETQPASPAALTEKEPRASEPAGDRMMSLATLGSLLPGIIQKPADEAVEQACTCIRELQSFTTTPVEKVILQLLNSGLTQLQIGSKSRTEQTASLFTYLYEKAYEGDAVPDTLLPEIIGKYVSWQSAVVAAMVPDQPAMLPMAGKADPKQNVAATLDIEQVRRLIKEELAQQRDSL